ncbi:cysteine desulfurase [Gordonia sp. HY002]|uniref:cysteine desulfurase family protein n=1 Tax=Gordonia zhenghanii TaxID=2911516 RepID=UPI001EEFC7CB|nr:cysteine desulfurase family protein [Gordonia zhenghanii]MCF8571397.1 cysteine desulfurase [Gordonia zhenghanii]MCF8608001.1 cysteine desulfurase [Gordonia zhenghanii]
MPTPRPSVYLDNAASTLLGPAAIEAMAQAWAHAGNASSLHGAGRRARRVLEEARESIAQDLGARPSEVIFTAGGTESDNLAVKGIYSARRAADERRRKIVVSAVEHHAVLDPAEWLVDDADAELVVLPVDELGAVRVDVLRELLVADADSVAVISVMWANNEVGTVQPIDDVARLGAEYGVPVHSDAIAAVGHVPVDFAASGLAAMSVAAHKFGGPQGAGVLVLKRDVACTPLLHGGGHERDIRSGTQDVPSAAGMAAALRRAVADRDSDAVRLTRLRDRLVHVLTSVGGVRINGALSAGDDAALPGLVHVSFEGCEGDSLLMLLDAKGVECSTGSACTAGVAAASHVLLAMGLDKATARGSLRFSLAPENDDDDVDAVAQVITEVIDRARAAGMLSAPGARSGGGR